MSNIKFIIFSNQQEIDKSTNDKFIDSDVSIQGTEITTITNIEKINGHLYLSNSIESLGDIKEITLGLYTWKNSSLESLGNLQKVGADLNLRFSKVKNLGKLIEVGGTLNLKDTEIDNLGILRYVGGNLLLSLKNKDKIDISKTTILGKVRYFKDAVIEDTKIIDPKEEFIYSDFEGNVPILDYESGLSIANFRYASIEQRQFYKVFKELFLNDTFIDIKGNRYHIILYLELCEDYHTHNDIEKLKHQFKNLEKYYHFDNGYFDGILLIFMELRDDYYETAWNLRLNREWIYSYSTITFYEEKLQKPLLDGELLKQLIGYSHLTPFGQKNIDKIKPFVGKQISILENEKGIKFYDMYVNNTVDNQLFILFRQAEDLYRESIGMPKIGMGWISETELFNYIKEAFFEDEVISQGRPEWLGLQRFDIYFPIYNIAIEYQGQQHFEEISLFGGKEGFKKVQENDRKKRELCALNNCYLMEVLPGYKIENILMEITTIIKERKASLNL